MIKTIFRLLLTSVILISQSCAKDTPSPLPTSARRLVTTEGQAAINNGAKLLARKQALQDAIRQAALQSSVNIHSQTMLNQDNVLFDAVTLRAAAAVSNTHILNEWIVDDVYHVKATVELAANDSCAPRYRKRILATAFPLAEQEQVSSHETQDLYRGIPREINHLLMESGEFIGTNATDNALYNTPDLAPALQDTRAYGLSNLMQIAESRGVQFVLSGVIRDMEIESGEYIADSGPVALTKNFLRDIWARRGIGIDIYVHDGFTGALLLQYRYTDQVAGNVWVPATYTVGSERFKATTTGKKITTIINRASIDIRRGLSCYPFVTRIIEIKDDHVFIDAGAQEHMNIGDQLVVYTSAGEELNLDGGTDYVGRDKQPAGILTISRITPRYAIGSLEKSPRLLGVKIGDWVRSW